MKKINLFDKKVEIAISELQDGNMRAFSEDENEVVIDRQKILTSKIDLDAKMVARINTHYEKRKTFTKYSIITSQNIKEYAITRPEKIIPISDGFVTTNHNIGFLLPLADCLGVVVYDKTNYALGLLHAGRHNIEQEGPRKFIKYFCEKIGSRPYDLQVYFSPCAMNYRIHKLKDKKLPDVALGQILNTGVLESNIEFSRIDTVSSDAFPSCSAGDKHTRFAIVTKQS